jgi:hypothetical protein
MGCMGLVTLASGKISGGVGLWKNIRRGWGVFSRFTSLALKDGSKIRF